MFPCGQEHAAQCSVRPFYSFIIVFSFQFRSLSIHMGGTICIHTFKLSLFLGRVI